MEINDLILDGLENLQRMIQKGTGGLTPAELKWRPHPEAESIALLFFHIVRVEDMATHDIQSKKPLWVAEKWYQKLNMSLDAGMGQLTPAQIAAFELPKRVAGICRGGQEQYRQISQRIKIERLRSGCCCASATRPACQTRRKCPASAAAVYPHRRWNINPHVNRTFRARGKNRIYPWSAAVVTI